MTRFHRLIGSAGLTCALAACVAATPPVEVTRFHNAQQSQIAYGSIAVDSTGNENFIRPLEQGIYDAAVLRELQKIGFTDAGSKTETSEYIARVSMDQNKVSAGGSRSPISVGVGGNTGGYGSGIGLGIGINLGGRPKDKIATELSVRITRRADSEVVWEGRSSVEAKEDSPAAQPGLAASKLAEALFKGFPGESGATIRVP